jgi:hypothetical protein
MQTPVKHQFLVFLIFGFWRRVDVLVDAYISKKHTVSIFQGSSDKAGNTTHSGEP